MTLLFNEIVFGPVISRRFGVSLGINLLPVDFKYCTFNCIYCECGWTYKSSGQHSGLPAREDVSRELEKRLKQMKTIGDAPDNITFAGNGEPTIHPAFAEIIDDTLHLRDKYFPNAEITVLSNASLLHKKKVFDALNKVDNNVLKLDSAIETTFRSINQPAPSIYLESIIENLKRFDGNQIIQTLFIRGEYKGQRIDNTTSEEIEKWIEVLKQIKPKYVMIYPIERDTAAEGLEKIPLDELESIAKEVNKAGIQTKVFG